MALAYFDKIDIEPKHVLLVGRGGFIVYTYIMKGLSKHVHKYDFVAKRTKNLEQPFVIWKKTNVCKQIIGVIYRCLRS